VVEAFVKRPFDAKSTPVVVELVTTEEVAKIFCAKRFRNLSVEDPSEPPRSEEGVMFPAICSLSVGEVTPIPMFPLDRILNTEAFDDEATLKMSFVPAIPLTLNEIVDDVALIPATVPLSSKVDVPRVVGVTQRVA
jgi:hypothetical protein